MDCEVVWASEALDDLRRLASYIERDSPAYASSVVKRVLDATRRLATYPRSGRVVPELGDEAFRELLVHNYRVMYRVEEQTVTIAAIAHSRQSLGIDDLRS